MIIDCISDLHGYRPNLPGGDLLIIAGDLTARSRASEYDDFQLWLSKQKYEKIILVAGNHDNGLQNDKEGFLSASKCYEYYGKLHYLEDSGIEIESITNCKPLKIWGTPWTPWFQEVDHRCQAFMSQESYLESKFSLIPEDTDILVTHGPMRHILDSNIDGYACGSHTLKYHVERVQPKFHVFGHIHEQGGNQLLFNHDHANTFCINCSYVDENYQPKNSYFRIQI